MTDPKRAYLRRKHTSTKKAHYTEGWVEFKDKKVARSVAEMLNAQPIGGKKGTRWRDDVWTMKYLPRFKWNMLTEQVGECTSSSCFPSLIYLEQLTRPPYTPHAFGWNCLSHAQNNEITFVRSNSHVSWINVPSENAKRVMMAESYHLPNSKELLEVKRARGTRKVKRRVIPQIFLVYLNMFSSAILSPVNFLGPRRPALALYSGK